MQKRRPPSYRVTPGATHGKIATYSCGCRCDLCRVAWRIYRRPKVAAYRARKRAEREAVAYERRVAEARALIAEHEAQVGRG